MKTPRGLPPSAWLALVVSMALGAGCAAGQAESVRDERPGVHISLLAKTTIPAEVEGIGRVGGLSGSVMSGREHADGRFWVLLVSDTKDGERILAAQARLTRQARWHIELEPHAPIGDVSQARDAEAVAFDPDRPCWYFAFEEPPTITAVDLARAPDPMEFRPAKTEKSDRTLMVPADIAQSFRLNRAFESVTFRSEANELWVGMEAAITIDGEEATPERGSLCRVLVYDATTDELDRQLFYETDPRPESFANAFAINSLAEMAALPDGRLLFLERSFAVPQGYGARLYIVDPDKTFEAEDRRFPTLEKTLVTDIKATGVPMLGNLEAMVVGPPIAELIGDDTQEGRLLLMIADDNFGTDGQRGSQVLAFRMMIEEPAPAE